MTTEQAFQQALSLSKKYTKETVKGMGAIKGEDGFSPIVSSREIEEGTEISITDATHTEIFVVKNGKVEVKEYTPYKSGIYKITVDEYGNISSAIPVTKEDIMALGIETGYEFQIEDNRLFYKPRGT